MTGLLDGFAALDGLFANIEQTYRRRFVTGQCRNERRAEHGELEQVFGIAIDVRAEIEHGGRPTLHVR
ncbi:hypothetical protein FQZ97_1197030 [compost metagenome]